jgi:hypothetical protein
VASQNTVFKASDAEICTPVTKLITNDRINFVVPQIEPTLLFPIGPSQLATQFQLKAFPIAESVLVF